MKVEPKELLAARRTGRSWAEIGKRFGMTVPEVKAAVEPLRAESRKKLAKRPLNAERLVAKCYCGDRQYEHKGLTGPCQRISHNQPCMCDEFELDPDPPKPWFSSLRGGLRPRHKGAHPNIDNQCPRCGGYSEDAQYVRNKDGALLRCGDEWHRRRADLV